MNTLLWLRFPLSTLCWDLPCLLTHLCCISLQSLPDSSGELFQFTFLGIVLRDLTSRKMPIALNHPARLFLLRWVGMCCQRINLVWRFFSAIIRNMWHDWMSNSFAVSMFPEWLLLINWLSLVTPVQRQVEAGTPALLAIQVMSFYISSTFPLLLLQVKRKIPFHMSV